MVNVRQVVNLVFTAILTLVGANLVIQLANLASAPHNIIVYLVKYHFIM